MALARHFLRFFLFLIFLQFLAAASSGQTPNRPSAPVNSAVRARRRERETIRERARVSKRSSCIGGVPDENERSIGLRPYCRSGRHVTSSLNRRRGRAGRAGTLWRPK